MRVFRSVFGMLLVIGAFIPFSGGPAAAEQSHAGRSDRLPREGVTASAPHRPLSSDRKRQEPLSLAYALYSRRQYRDAAGVLEEFLAGRPAKKSEEAARFLLGDCYYREMHRNPQVNMQLALNTYLTAIRSFPGSPLVSKATYRTAEIYRKQKMYNKAVYLYKKILHRFPDSLYAAWSRFSLGKIQIENHQEGVGLKTILDIFRRYPDAPFLTEVRGFLIRYYMDREEYEKAMDEFRKIPSEQVENTPDLRKRYDEVFLRLCRDQECREFLFKRINLHPKDPMVSKWTALIGDTFRRMGKRKEALKIYYETKSRYPGTEGDLLARAGILDLRSKSEEKGALEKAAKGYDRLISKTPEGPLRGLALMRKAEMYYHAGHLAKSIPIYRKFLSAYPENSYRRDAEKDFRKALLARVRDLFDKKKYLEVVELVQKNRSYILKGPMRPNLEWKIAESHRRVSLPRTAATMMERMMEKYPRYQKNDTFVYRLGKAYFEMGDTDKCRETLRRFLKQFPGSGYRSEVDSILGRIAFSTGDYPRAVRHFQLAYPKSASGIPGEDAYFFGVSYWRLGKLDDALRIFQSAVKPGEKAVDSSPRNFVLPQIRCAIADLLYDMGRIRDALKAYQDIVSTYPDDKNSDWANYRIGRIQYLLGRESEALKTLKRIRTGEKKEFLRKLIRNTEDEISLDREYRKTI